MPPYRVRTTKTASGATAVQVVSYEKHVTKVVKHVGSAKTEEELEVLRSAAEQYALNNEPQLSLFKEIPNQVVLFNQIEVSQVSQRFARSILLELFKQCHLDSLDLLYLDLAIIRIIEPCSKLRSIELIQRYFNVSYTQYVYKLLPKLLDQQTTIEKSAIKTAR